MKFNTKVTDEPETHMPSPKVTPPKRTRQYIEKIQDRRFLITKYADGSEKIQFFYLKNGIPFSVEYLSNSRGLGDCKDGCMIDHFIENVEIDNPYMATCFEIERQGFINYCLHYIQ